MTEHQAQVLSARLDRLEKAVGQAADVLEHLLNHSRHVQKIIDSLGPSATLRDLIDVLEKTGWADRPVRASLIGISFDDEDTENSGLVSFTGDPIVQMQLTLRYSEELHKAYPDLAKAVAETAAEVAAEDDPDLSSDRVLH